MTEQLTHTQTLMRVGLCCDSELGLGQTLLGSSQRLTVYFGEIGFNHGNEHRLRRQWHPTPVLLPGNSHARRSLVGCSPWGREESDTTSLSLSTFMHRRRKWQPTPVFLPGESQGWGSLVGCHLWSHTESDTTEVT